MEAIRGSEGLWRDIYRERHKRALTLPKSERVVSNNIKSAFGTTRRPDPALSTNRYDGVSLEFATAEGDVRAAKIEGANRVEGWLIIRAEDAVRHNRRVEPDPKPDNPYHTLIIFPVENADPWTWEDARMHLQELLGLGRWQDRDTSSVRRFVMSRMTWAERAFHRIITAQREGRLEQQFRIADVRRIFPECPSWVLSDHRRSNPEARSEWFVRHGPGLYSVAPSRLPFAPNGLDSGARRN